jgi:ribonuclease R
MVWLFPDLVTHRLLNWYLHNEPSVNQKEYEEICEHSSEMERKAVCAERDSIKYKQAEFLLDKVGKEFCGLISGVSKWGLYVEIEENKCEGMIHLKDMKDDFYYLDEDNYRIIGQSFGNTYKLGDKVNIKVKDVDLSRKQIDFLFVD